MLFGKAPLEGFAKFNVDSAESSNDDHWVVGVMLHTKQGKFLSSSSITLKNITYPTVLEAPACQEALALVDDLCCTRYSSCQTIWKQ